MLLGSCRLGAIGFASAAAMLLLAPLSAGAQLRITTPDTWFVASDIRDALVSTRPTSFSVALSVEKDGSVSACRYNAGNAALARIACAAIRNRARYVGLLGVKSQTAYWSDTISYHVLGREIFVTGDNGGAIHLSGAISFADYPVEAKQVWRQGVVAIDYGIGVDGRVNYCRIVVSSNSSVIDETTCRVVTRRYRYAPALSAVGTAVATTARLVVTYPS